MANKRKIIAITGYRSEYLKQRSVLFALKNREDIQLKIIAIGPHNLDRFGNTYQDILDDGFKISYQLYTHTEGDSTAAMVQSITSVANQLSPILLYEQPDIVLLCADRFEMYGAATAAAFNNMIIGHIEGGEVTGTIDESVRHCITKLSHIHFPSTDLSRQRIIRMGEKNVFNFGCPFMDYIKTLEIDKDRYNFLKKNFPLLQKFDNYGIIIQHPVTTEYKQSYKQMQITLNAVQNYGLPCLLIWPNADSGSEKMCKAIRDHQRKYGNKSKIVDAWRTMPVDLYLNLLYHSSCLIGNSSSGIREAFVYGVGVVNIGSRQNGRERTKNVVDTNYEKEEIIKALKKSLNVKIYDQNLYGDGNAGIKIANKLATIDISYLLEKKFYD